jgi:purine-binding chemotaxis protein CheW
VSSLDSTAADPVDMVLMCSLRVGAGLFGIETTQIREVLGATATRLVPLAPIYINGIMPYRGEVLTAVNMRALLGLPRYMEAGCVIVLDDEVNEEQFGLVVDGVGGVIAMARSGLEPNPSALDARSLALYDGICRTDLGLMVRLNPQRLRPSRLADSGLFGAAARVRGGEQR